MANPDAKPNTATTMRARLRISMVAALERPNRVEVRVTPKTMDIEEEPMAEEINVLSFFSILWLRSLIQPLLDGGQTQSDSGAFAGSGDTQSRSTGPPLGPGASLTMAAIPDVRAFFLSFFFISI
jgi:hypothetical protein